MRLGGSRRTQINQMVSHAGMVGSDGRPGFFATILLPFGSSLRLSNYRRRVESAPRLPSELRRSGSPHGSAVGGNRTHLPASAANELVELGTARVSALWAEHLAI